MLSDRNRERVNRAMRRAGDSGSFVRYANYLLDELPELRLSTIRNFHEFNASASEIRAHYGRMGSAI